MLWKEVGIGYGKISPEEGIHHDNTHCDQKGGPVGEPGYQGHALPAGDKLRQDIKKQEEDRQYTGDKPGGGMGIPVFQVLDGCERTEDLGQFPHPSSDDGKVYNPSADISHGIPDCPVTGPVTERASAEKHVTAHRCGLQGHCRYKRSDFSSSKKVPFEILCASLTNRPEPYTYNNYVVKNEEHEYNRIHASPPSS